MYRACAGQPATLARLRERYPGVQLVVTTINHESQYREAIERLVADELVRKTDLADVLVRTLCRLTH